MFVEFALRILRLLKKLILVLLLDARLVCVSFEIGYSLRRRRRKGLVVIVVVDCGIEVADVVWAGF